ncbi:MAG: lipid A biosynthesis acyltransferase [Flavobacteriaceae bacterium]|nr:lipid A biosynthesis acyltransferase [Flavobacteriaceae bacterium]
MQRLAFILVYPIIWLISILPFRLLYMLSDILFVVIYYIIGYRKKVVFENLTLAFPEKSKEEIKEIQKKSYRHFVDIFMEMIKSFTISKKELDKRFKYTNIDIFKEFEKDDKSIMVYAMHYANWEWVVGLNPSEKYGKYVVFKKISNPYFDNVVKKSRERFGIDLKYTYEIKRVIEHNFNNHKKAIYGFLNDQSPRINRAEYWRNFMGVYVPVHTGSENFAKKYDMNVLYLSTKRIKRGYYENTFHILSTDAKKEPNFSITDKYIDLVEQQLREQPEFYFWTHRRFKHRNKAKK